MCVMSDKQPRKRARLDMSKEEREQAERVAAIARRAEERALARLEAKKREQTTSTSRPKIQFLTKAQRLARAKEREKIKNNSVESKRREQRNQSGLFRKRSKHSNRRQVTRKDKNKEGIDELSFK